jgi:nucleotide-binding universal stress UspA family protein
MRRGVGGRDVILIGYDGSPDAYEAVTQAGSLMLGHPAIVVTVWDPRLEEVAEAERLAAEGAELSRQSQLDATHSVLELAGTVADTILRESRTPGCRAIVIGRGRGDDGLGSVSRRILHEALRPVVVVAAADERTPSACG